MNWLVKFALVMLSMACIIILSWWIGTNTHWAIGLFIGLAFFTLWAIIYEGD